MINVKDAQKRDKGGVSPCQHLSWLFGLSGMGINMFENDDNCRYGNHARVNPKKPKQINGAYQTYTITCNETNEDGEVSNVLEDNAYLAHDFCNENQK